MVESILLEKKKKNAKCDNPRVIGYSSYPRSNRAKDLRGECSKKSWQRPNNLKHFEFDERYCTI